MHFKFGIVLLIACLVVVPTSAKPAKRATCELGAWVGDAACAAHCIALNHTGGWCDSHNYCICKPETIVGKRKAKQN